MNPNIPQNLRIAVIGLYLQGETRNEIASRTGVSQGSVSNIISDWKKGLDESEAGDLRDLGIMMKRASMTPLQCASGFRMAQLLNKSGVNEDGFKNYIFDFYTIC
jgi:Homeodomain-like domain-containing protein